MGWWSDDIMGGDTPLDILGGYAKILGAPFATGTDSAWHCYEITPQMFTPATVSALDARAARYKYDGNVAHQVLAVLLMRYGADLPGELRARCIAACDADEWAAEGDAGRRRKVAALRAAVESYSGEAVNMDRDRGLLAVVEGAR